MDMVYSPWIIWGLAFRKVCMVIFQANLKNLLMMLLNISPKSEHNQSSRIFQASFLGHSMGWAMALKVHLKQPLAWDGTILVAPMYKIAKEIAPPLKVLQVLELVSRLFPKQKVVSS